LLDYDELKTCSVTLSGVALTLFPMGEVVWKISNLGRMSRRNKSIDISSAIQNKAEQTHGQVIPG